MTKAVKGKTFVTEPYKVQLLYEEVIHSLSTDMGVTLLAGEQPVTLLCIRVTCTDVCHEILIALF